MGRGFVGWASGRGLPGSGVTRSGLLAPFVEGRVCVGAALERRSVEQGNGADKQRSGADEQGSGADEKTGVIRRRRRMPELTAEDEARLRAYWVEAGLKERRLERVMAMATMRSVWRDTDELHRRKKKFHELVPDLPYKEVVRMFWVAPHLMAYNSSTLHTLVQKLQEYLVEEGVTVDSNETQKKCDSGRTSTKSKDNRQDLGSFLRKAPHIIGLSVPNVETKVAAMREALPTANVRFMIQKDPMILNLSVTSLKQKVERLREIFPAAVNIDNLISHAPGLLKSDIDQTVASKLEYLQEVLPPHIMGKLYSMPSLYWVLTLSQARLDRLGAIGEKNPDFRRFKSPLTILKMKNDEWEEFMRNKEVVTALTSLPGTSIKHLRRLHIEVPVVPDDDAENNSNQNTSIDHRNDLQRDHPIIKRSTHTRSMSMSTSTSCRGTTNERTNEAPKKNGENTEKKKIILFVRRRVGLGSRRYRGGGGGGGGGGGDCDRSGCGFRR